MEAPQVRIIHPLILPTEEHVAAMLAHMALAAAIALSRAMDMTFWLPQAESALAQVSG
jgi:hypothetical protein